MGARPLASCAGLLAASLAGAVAASPPGPQAASVLLVTVDTLRPDALGWVAGRNATPEIDRLAAEGARFAGAISPVPLTLPAHVSILTGLEPPRHGVRDNGHVLGPGVPTLAEELRAQGYRTAAFVSGYPLRALFGLGRGFDKYDDALAERGGQFQDRPAAETVRAALAWLTSEPRRGPFFLWVHFYDPHDPYTPPAACRRPGPRGDYDGEVACVDAALGELRRAVAARAPGALLTVLTSDHGESLGEHGEDTHGFFVYDSTLRVPLLLHFPGRVRPGAPALAPRLVDVAPTLLDLLGLRPDRPTDGVSLRPTLEGRRQELPPAYFETLQPFLGYGWAPLSGLQAGRFKLIDAPRPELYELASDPGETRNTHERDPHRATRLTELLLARRSQGLRPASAADDPQVLERLRSLGYLGGGSAPAAGDWPRGLADPKDRLALRARLHEGEALLARGDLAGARLAFESTLKEEPDNRFALLRLGTVLARQGRFREAQAPLERLAGIDPRQAEARYLLGEALLRTGSWTRAVTEWVEVTRLQPRRAAAWSNLALALLRSDQAAEAVRALEEAVRLEPGQALYLENLQAAREELARRAAPPKPQP